MAIEFTKNIEEYTTVQRNARVKHFAEYTSKKQLADAGVLSEEALAFATSIKGTFNYALHEDKRYMAVTLYKASEERKYKFLILDLQDMAIAEADSIKNAKADILELVEEQLSQTVQNLLEEQLAEQESKGKGKKKNSEEDEPAEDAEANEEEADEAEQAEEA